MGKELVIKLELITKLADDVWEVATQIDNFELEKELKTISGCLHDIRADRDAEWYLKRGNRK